MQFSDPGVAGRSLFSLMPQPERPVIRRPAGEGQHHGAAPHTREAWRLVSSLQAFCLLMFIQSDLRVHV